MTERDEPPAGAGRSERGAPHRNLFATMIQGVVYQAPDGRILSANPAAERILGLSLAQMQGRTSLDPRWRAIREDGSEFPGDQHPAMEALRTGRAVNGVTMGVFHPARGEHRWLLVDAVPEFRPGETRPCRAYATFTDITDRRKAEQELRTRTEELGILLEVSRNLAATLDLTRVLQATTDGVTRLFGSGTAAVYLLDGDRLTLEATTPPLPPGFPDELRRARLEDHPHVGKALASGAPVVIEDAVSASLTAAEQSVVELRRLRTVLYLPLVAGVKPVGTLIVGSLEEPRPVPEDDVGLCRTLANLAALAVENALLHDSARRHASDLERQIVERRRAEQDRLELERKLLHAQKLESLGILAGGIAHDFNNLLMAILANLEMALRRLPAESPASVNIERSVQAAHRATDLTRQMLAYSGKGRFVVTPVDLSALVEENAHLFRASVPRTATLELHLDRSAPPVEADAGQVQQVVMNLITNASEAIGGGPGRIVITTEVREYDATSLERSRTHEVPPPGRFVSLEVSDTGCGMDQETQRRLFDPFFTTKERGRGLGMSAILGIVSGHGGAIFVDSTAGRGTSMRMLFPAAEPARSPERQQGCGAAAAHAVSAGTVLVVDDEESVRAACRDMVEALGLGVLTATDGKDAIEVFGRHADSISHVILDLSMPHLDGVRTLTELVRVKPAVKVILSSGYNEQEVVQRVSRRGLAGFIQKPYSLDALRGALEAAGAWRG